MSTNRRNPFRYHDHGTQMRSPIAAASQTKVWSRNPLLSSKNIRSPPLRQFTNLTGIIMQRVNASLDAFQQEVGRELDEPARQDRELAGHQ